MALHNLAYELHMTVAQLCSSMTAREFAGWVAWYHQRARTAPEAPPPAAPGSAIGRTLDLTTDAGVAQLASMFKKA